MSTIPWLDSPDGSLWHPAALIFGRDARLILSTLLGSLIVFAASHIFSRLDKQQRESAVKVAHPAPPQVLAGWQGGVLESQSLLGPTDRLGSHIRCFDASTGWHLSTIEADTRQTIDAKLEAATAAAASWADSTWTTRRKLLRSLLHWVLSDQEQIVRVACRDTGKAAVDAFFGEILVTSSKLKYLIDNAAQALKPESRPNGNLLLAHKRSKLYYKPYGVVLASVSWNYPFHNILGPITAALASGNAIVVKPSEHVAWSTTYYVQCIHRILSALNLPTTLVTLVLAHPPLAPYLSMHPSIKHITFIGSEGVGKKVMADATRNLTPVTLELGGKDPAIILAGTKIKEFASVFLRAVYQSAGQNCIGIERFVVHESLVEELVDAVVPRVKAMRLGSWLQDTPKGRLEESSGRDVGDDGVDCGAMITDLNFDDLEGLIADAVQRGAKLHVGGKRHRHAKWAAGNYFEPTLLSNVTEDMPIAQRECFAPVFLVMPFREVKDAIRIANGTKMGLGSSVFGNDRAQVRYVQSHMKAGMCNLNDFAVSYLNQSLPFGGVKMSGFGRFAGPEGLRGLCYTQAVIEDRFFSLVRTSIPPPVDYPLRSSAGSFNFVAGLHHLAFSPSWTGKARGLWKVIVEAVKA
ncbi:unnamed protein product [Parajaminaea phylloscopi]